MSAKDGDTYYLRVGSPSSPYVVQVDTVVSPAALAKGLSGRPSMPKGTGLLFIFSGLSVQSMWMKDMRFPLDVVWLDENLEVSHINYGAAPCGSTCPSYSSHYKAAYAIELNAGDAAAYGFRVGVPLKVVS